MAISFFRGHDFNLSKLDKLIKIFGNKYPINIYSAATEWG